MYFKFDGGKSKLICNSMNNGAHFWNNGIGVNTIPANTQIKKPLINWKAYQENPVSEETFEQWKKKAHLRKELR